MGVGVGGGGVSSLLGNSFVIIILKFSLFKGGRISIVPFCCERKENSEYHIISAGLILFSLI